MKFLLLIRFGCLLALLATSAPAAASRAAKQDTDMGEVASTVARMLEKGHFSRTRLNEEVEPGVTQARKALERYFEILDHNRLFFTQQDIEEFTTRYGERLQDDILLGDLSPAYGIYDLFLERVRQRVGAIEKLLERDFTFDSNRQTAINRDKKPWPADRAEADRLWKDRIEAELLQAVLAERALEEAAAKKRAENPEEADAPATEAGLPKRTPQEQILGRYQRLLKSLEEETREDHASTFLSALAQSYDPHSEYMSPRALENFKIQLGLSLVGIGAELRTDDDYAKIQRLIPGGPAERGGDLRVNDRIVAVAQGDGEFEDVVGMKLDRVVERIRGKKGTTVRLQVLRATSPDPSKFDIVTIVRDEVKLTDEEARAQVIEVSDDDGQPVKVGVITLPSFYANMDRQRGPVKSTTQDVSALLRRLKREGIEGLIIDLRRDSGGSLDEAVRLTGLFIPSGPVVQSKDTNGNINAMFDRSNKMLWDGPLVVLMNRLSASASEIFAGALQDYGRAIIVGDEQSFGKGTVQTLVDVDSHMPLFARDRNAGAVKLTIQKYYRVQGGSTQLHGVASDIVLPSLTDQTDVGEGALRNPLDYDEVPARRFTPVDRVAGILPALRAASEARVAANPEFAYVVEDKERLRERLDENFVSLNKATRLAEIEADKNRRAARNEERQARETPLFSAVEVTLGTLDAKELQPVALDRPPKRSGLEDLDDADPSAPDEKEPFVDPVRDEALLIMRDWIQLEGQPPVTARAPAADVVTP
jgi:carboxyl-terminal processing protease